MSIRYKKYLPIDFKLDEAFAYCIEDPINIEHNPGYSVLVDSPEYERIVKEFRKAYQAISTDKLPFFSIPYKY